jgi:7-cyano-7-deazaguanine synthase
MDASGRALVLFSGGQDSTVCLAWALARYARVETVAFDYGQRHAIELEQRLVVLDELKRMGLHADRLGAHHLLDLRSFGAIGESALTTQRAIEIDAAGLPTTFVPARNIAFLTYAAALAYRRGIDRLVGGMCETDFSGYPDCRNDTLQALAQALSLGLAQPLSIETPLMWLDKAATWNLARELGGDDLIEIIVEHTHTCYLGTRDQRHAWGYGCEQCPSCALRADGWRRWQSAITSNQLRRQP